MKKIIISIVFMLTSIEALASSGRAIIPHYLVDTPSGLTTYFYITNITQSPISVDINLFRKDGTLMVDDGSPSTGFIRASSPYLAYTENTSDSAFFTLGAKQTMTLRLIPQNYEVGFGEIIWLQDGNDSEGLVVYGRVFRSLSSKEMIYPILVNGGKPF